MATAEEGGAAANTTSSSYGGGGAGGKFRKKPFRRQTTPYDRPPTAIRGNNIINNNNNNSSWLTKLVVEPASKLISYGADRFFGSVFRRRLPPPPPPPLLPQPPESNADVSDEDQGAGLDLKSQDGAPEPGGGERSQPVNSSSSTGVVELEQLLRQKTFTRSEIVHLTELLKSRAVEVSLGDASQKNEEAASDFGRHQEFAGGHLEGNRNGEIRPFAVVSTPIHNSKVLEDDIASPAELAKAYMGSRPSKVSPSVLGMRSQLGREDTGLLTSMPFASKSPVMSLTKKTSFSLGAPENGFITPRSRGRSAIYSMARTPYSRVHPTSILKRTGINPNGYAGPSTSSTSLSPVENNKKFESQPMTLKRRSSVLDDEVGSVGPIRRIRQKPNLLAPRFHYTPHGVGIGSHPKQQLQLIGDQRNKDLKNSGENENESVPSTSYARVPSKSSEVAARILQQLEKLTPKEKSSESKLVAVREKSPLKSTPSMLSGQALRSTEDVGSSKLMLDVHDDHKYGDRTNATLPDVHDSSPRQQGKAEENGPKASASLFPSSPWNPAVNNDSAVSLKATTSSIGAADSAVKNGASQPPQKKRAFRMSAEEDSLEQVDVQCNGLASRSLSEKKGPMEFPSAGSKLAHAEEPKLVKTKIQSEDKSPLDLISGRTSEHSPGAVTDGERTSPTAIQASEETRATLQSEGFASSVAAFDKTKEASSPPLFGFSSKVAEKFPSLPSESIKRAESELKSSSGLVNISASIGSQVKIPESDKGLHLKFPKAGDINGKRDDVSLAAANGQLVSSSSPASFPAASSGDTNQISTGSGLLFSSSSSITNFVPTSTSTSSSAASSGSIFGLASKPSGLGGPVFKFGSSVDPSTSVSAALTNSISEVADQRTKVDINPSFGSSSSSHATVAAFAAASSGNSTVGLGSSASSSTGNNTQGSLFGVASKSPASGAGTVLQGTSGQSVSSTSVPAFNVNTSTSLGSSPNPSNTFGFSSSASSSDTSSLAPVGGPTSSLFKFGASPTAVSEGSAASFSTSATPGIFSFGFSSSSSSTTTVGSSSGATPSIFSSGGTSAASASVFNTGSSFSSDTSGIFNFGGSSSASSSAINSFSSSSAPSAVFGSSWRSPKSTIFGSTFTSPSPSTGFSFGAQSTSSASTNAAASMVFGSSSVASSSPIFSFTVASASASSSPSLSNAQPVFGNPTTSGGFAASPGNTDQMNAEDSMAEDPVPASAPVPVFGQPSVSPSPPGFTFGPNVPSQTNPFVFSGQQNQVAPQNPPPFQASGSLEFSAGGSFSLGSGGGDKSVRKIVKVSRTKNRKK